MKTKLLLFFLLSVIIQINAQQQIYSLSGTPKDFIKFNNNILFVGYTEDSGYEIWQSDGTSANTSILKDIYSGEESGAQDFYESSTILDGKLFFIGKDENSMGEIWKTDGTANGTVKITNFLNGRVLKLTTVGNSIFFLLKIKDLLQVWKTDGSEQGTILLKDNLPVWNTPTFEGKCNNIFIFTCQTYGTNDSRVWRSDGTSEGTFPLTENMDGNGSGPGGTSALTQYIEKDNKLYFVSRYYLFETDGTVENTKNVANLWNAGNSLVSSGDVIEANNNLYFMFFSADYFKLEIWKFDLTNRNASVVYTNQSSQYFYPSNLVKTDDSLLFCGPNAAGGTELLSMKLNDNSISNLKELAPNADKPFIFFGMFDRATIYRINTKEYVITSATDKNYESKGWISNISSKLTENITALDNVWNAIVYNDNLYYGKDNKLWKYAKNLSTISFDNKSSLVLYPNPSSDYIDINIKNDDIVESVDVFDLNGRLVSTLSDYKNNQIDISRLTQGVYNMKLKLNGSSINKKIIKK